MWLPRNGPYAIITKWKERNTVAAVAVLERRAGCRSRSACGSSGRRLERARHQRSTSIDTTFGCTSKRRLARQSRR